MLRLKRVRRDRPGSASGYLAWPLALLICIVTFVVLKEPEIQRAGRWCLSHSIGNKSRGVSDDLYQPAKTSRVLRGVRENVAILDPTPEIDKASEGLRFQNIERRDRGVLRCAPADTVSIWCNQTTSDLLILVEENMIWRQRGITNVALYVRPQMFGWRTPGIFIPGRKAEVVQGSILYRFPKIPQPISTDESALIVF